MVSQPSVSTEVAAPESGRRRIPLSTYRIQLRNGLTLDGVVDDGWLDHAAALGVSHLYLSPILGATPGSTHGYDMVDPRHVDETLGGEAALERLHRCAQERGLGLIVDIVPNHMAADPVSNRYWWDVLRNGPQSEFWWVFDIDSDHPEPRLRDRIMWPVLDDRYGRVLDGGRITLGHTDDQLVALIDDRPLPLAPSSAAEVLDEAAGATDDDRLRLVVAGLAYLAHVSPDQRPAYQRAVDGRLAAALKDESIRTDIESTLERINSEPDLVHEILEQQHYRLAYWRAARDLGYRRFFDVNELIGIREEDPEVFQWAHEAVRGWLERDLIDGLRVDHPDGLAQPADYFRRLRTLLPTGWIVAEKILETGEQLPADWEVDGTTGYDFSELIGRWFLDPDGLHQLGLFRDDLVGPGKAIHELVADCKRLVLEEMLSADLSRATDALLQMCESQRRFRDVTRHALHEMLREIVITYPVYRSYVAPGSVASEGDLGLISMVIATVRDNRPDLDPEVLDLLESVLTGRLDAEIPEAPAVRLRVEQLSGPAMAKGKEDTAFYRHVRLISRCEVGADPAASGVSIQDLHSEFEQIAELRPHTMTLLSSHDSKRSEDVRARLSVLTEVDAQWRDFALAAMAMIEELDPDGEVDIRTRYMLLQTAVGAHPLDGERLAAFALKAVKEAKERTSWLRPEPAYEDAVERLSHDMCSSDKLVELVDGFVGDFLIENGHQVSIAQKALQLLGPGIPDVYWGAEDMFLRLVDPDNRTIPDLDSLRDRLAEIAGGVDSGPLLSENRTKIGVVAACLAIRSDHPECFESVGSYSPLETTGADTERVLAFARGDSVVAIVARWPSRGALSDDTHVTLPPGNWQARICGEAGQGQDSVLAGYDLPEEHGSPGGQIALAGTVPVRELLGEGSVAALERVV